MGFEDEEEDGGQKKIQSSSSSRRSAQTTRTILGNLYSLNNLYRDNLTTRLDSGNLV